MSMTDMAVTTSHTATSDSQTTGTGTSTSTSTTVSASSPTKGADVVFACYQKKKVSIGPVQPTQ